MKTKIMKWNDIEVKIRNEKCEREKQKQKDKIKKQTIKESGEQN
jgi:hypothetical protein